MNQLGAAIAGGLFTAVLFAGQLDQLTAQAVDVTARLGGLGAEGVEVALPGLGAGLDAGKVLARRGSPNHGSGGQNEDDGQEGTEAKLHGPEPS